MSLKFQRREWQSRSACMSADPDLFFPVSAAGPSAVQAGKAKAICARCPVRQECTDFALDHREVQGIWGGTTEAERKKLRRARTGSAAAA
jgi:WhiB family redox-sensing transcriptional regulator